MGKNKDKPIQDEVLDTLRSRGLDVAEESLMLLAKSAIAVLTVLIPKVAPGWGMFVIPILKTIEPKLLKLIDKLDGEIDQ